MAPSTNPTTSPIAGRLAGADPNPSNLVQDLAAELARRLFADAAEAGPADPLLVGHTGAAKLLGVSEATWHRRLAAGQVGPEPLKWGGRVLWNTAELREWAYDVQWTYGGAAWAIGRDGRRYMHLFVR